MIENNRTLPYGEAWLSDVASGNDKKFTTYDRDKESGLDYAMARMYQNTGGRLTSPDKGPYILYLPVTLNRYQYSRNDPINYVDPTGREGTPVGTIQYRGPSGGGTGPTTPTPNLPVIGGGGKDNGVGLVVDEGDGEKVGGGPAVPTAIGTQGLDCLKEYEAPKGPLLKQDDDGYGFQTIGYGHKIKAGEDYSMGIALQGAEDLLRKDLAWAVAGVRNNVGVFLSQNQFDALVMFVFNVGVGSVKDNTGFLSSSLLKNLNAGSAISVPSISVFVSHL